MKIRAKLIIDIETDVDDNISDKETLRFLVDEDLKSLGYIVYNCELKNQPNETNKSTPNA